MPYKDNITKAEYNRNYLKIYYQVNIKSERLRLMTRKNNLRKFVNEYKNQFPCHYCNGSENLQFHHEDPTTKYKEVSVMISNGNSKEMIMEEIKKCIIICRKCHHKINDIISLY